MSGAWGTRGRRRKMGYEGSAPSPRKRVDSRMTQGGVEFTLNSLTGQVTCTMCGQYGSATDLAYMLDHAAKHRPVEVARVQAMARITSALPQLGAAELDQVAELVGRLVGARA